MLQPIPVTLIAYDPAWSQMAAGHAERLRAALGAVLVEVHHIGSTAVPGLAAKPIIDLMPVVTNLAELDGARGRVESLGYEWHGELGIEGRRYCTLADEAGNRIAQAHFFADGSPHVARHLAFRNYLRAHPGAAREYEAVKRRARELHPDDSHAYGGVKGVWVQATETAALAWYGAQGITVSGR